MHRLRLFATVLLITGTLIAQRNNDPHYGGCGAANGGAQTPPTTMAVGPIHVPTPTAYPPNGSINIERRQLLHHV